MAEVLEIFRAFIPRRRDKSRNDRTFLEALHYFATHNVTWRALLERLTTGTAYGSASTGEQGGRARDLLRPDRHGFILGVHGQIFDSAVVCAPVSAAVAKRGRTDRYSAAHVPVSPPKIPLRLTSTVIRLFPTRLAARRATRRIFRSFSRSAPTSARDAVGDKNYGSATNRKVARRRGIIPLSRARPTKRISHSSSPTRVQTSWPRRTRRRHRQAQALQMRCATLRKDEAEPCRHYRSRAGFILIKPAYTI